MSNLADGYAIIMQAIARGLLPDPNMPIDEWADMHMIIPADSGANEYGPYRTSRTPHARAVMRSLSPSHRCKRVVVMGASQMLKTQVALNMLGATIHQAPSNFLWIVPTGNLVKRSSIRIDKTIKAVPVLAERVADKRSRDAANNLTTKEYIGGTLHILTAGAAANLSEVSARYIVYDEIDRSENNVGNEGSPGALAEARQTTFQENRKIYYPSSPTIEGESPIDNLFRIGTQQEAVAECIHCGHAQTLVFENLIRSEDGQSAMYPCIECGGLHFESDKTRMFVNGLWTEGVPGDGETDSYTISQMYLPYGWLPWIALLRLYEKAKSELDQGNENEMIVFYNTRLARCWARSKESTRYDELMSRAEDYRLGTVPMGGLILTAAIDTQAYRLELKVVAWGEGMESWVIDYQVIHGSPSETETWDKADEILKGRYRHAGGAMLNISAAFVDSGGSATQDVYNFTSSRKRRNIFAVKGHSRPNRPIVSGKPSQVDVTWRGKTEKKGAQLWLIGPDTAKDYLQSRWARTGGAGAVHFSKDLPESYFKGLTAEFRTHGYKRGRKVSWWEQKKGDPNEPLDLMVYNLGAAYFLELHKKSEHGWQSLRDRLVPMSGDLFLQDPQTAPAPRPVQTSALPDDAPPRPQAAFADSTAPARRPPDAPAAPPAQPARVYSGRISLGPRRGGA